MLLSVSYCPPVSWFAAAGVGIALSADGVIPSKVVLEARENYQKQSWRNRCRIMTANGIEDLSVPVVHDGGTFKLPIREIRIDYTEPWVMRTERAMASAYESSPFFDYYKDELFAILDSRMERLWDLDMTLIGFFLSKLRLPVELSFTESYVRPEGREWPAGGALPHDLRELIHPKRPDHVLDRLGLGKPYFQVFFPKYGFVPNLSIMDLLFSEGPDSVSYLHTPPIVRTSNLG